MSFYKYKEQDVKDTQVDWGKIGEGFRKEVDTIATERQAKRDEIEKNYQDLKNKIESESPLGSHAGANEAMAKFASDAAQKALDMNRRMKAGDIEPSANTAFMTNLTSSTQNMFEIGKAFNANYDEVMQRHLEGGIGAAEELAYLQQAEIFNGHGEPFVGEDGQVYLASRVNGVLDTENPISLQQAKAAATQRVDKFDMATKSAAVAEALDKPWTEAVRRGKVKTVEDARNNPAFSKALDAMVAADLDTPSAMLSILLDNSSLGYEYDVTGNRGGDHVIHAIYSEDTGRYEPILTPEMEAQAREIYANTILAQIGRKETAVEKTQEWELNRGEGKKKYRDTINMASKLYSGDPDEIMAAREYFLGLNKDIKNITRTTDGVVVTYLTKDGSTTSNTISFKGQSGAWKTEADFIRSLTELTGDGDLEDAIKRNNIRGTVPTQHSSTEGASRTVTEEVVLDKGYGEIELDIAGQDNLVTVDAAFDAINIDGEYFTGNEGDRQIITDGYEEVVSGIMNNLSGEKTKGMKVGKVNEGADYFEIYLPGNMTGPFYLPIEEGDEMMTTQIKNATRAIYDAANNGDIITPRDIASAMNIDTSSPEWSTIQKGLFEEYGHEWNDGDGRVMDGGGQSQTSATGANSSAQFNSGS
tara:strand:+ start:236 stop:2167 length:1932 start_codon:yes stop_codon:yes gene_type:complete